MISRTVSASDDAGRREPCDLVFHHDPLDSVTSDAQQSKTVEFVPPLGQGMRGMSGRLVRLYEGLGVAAERARRAMRCRLVPPAETISVPPCKTVDALTSHPRTRSTGRCYQPSRRWRRGGSMIAASVSAIMHHREVRVRHPRACAYGHLRRRSQAHPSMPRWHCRQAHSMAVRNAAPSMARIRSHSPAPAGSWVTPI